MAHSSALLQAFLDELHKKRGYSLLTLQSYEYDVLALLVYLKQHNNAQLSLTKEQCRAFLAERMKSGLSARSMSRAISTYRNFWGFLVQHKHCQNNPWTYIRSPKLKKTLPHILSTKEVLQFLDQLPNQTAIDLRDRAICEILYGFGIRVSELCSITMEQLNLPKGECRVIGKGDKERIVLFGEMTRSVLIDYVNHARPVWRTTSSTTLIMNKQGSPITPRSIQRILKKRSVEQGMQRAITPHTLRHCFASDLYKGGADLNVIKKLLGHEHLATTEIYTHVANDELRQTMFTAHPLAKQSKKDR